jgi:hypothetical protein
VAKIVNTPEAPATQQVESVSVALLQAPTNTEPAASIIDAQIFNVQGIMYDPARPSAIVNGKTVYVGDRLGDFRVKQISKNSITLTGPGGTNEVVGLGE